MYAAGKLPDHVTRYNHKDMSRWLVPPQEPRRVSIHDVIDGIALMISGAGVITFAVFCLQMM